MTEEQIVILEKYLKYRRDNPEVRDEAIDDIFYKEIYWPNSDEEKVWLFTEYSQIENFFKLDVRKNFLYRTPRKWGGEGPVCGTLARNDAICASINDVVYARIHEELEKREKT